MKGSARGVGLRKVQQGGWDCERFIKGGGTVKGSARRVGL